MKAGEQEEWSGESGWRCGGGGVKQGEWGMDGKREEGMDGGVVWMYSATRITNTGKKVSVQGKSNKNKDRGAKTVKAGTSV